VRDGILRARDEAVMGNIHSDRVYHYALRWGLVPHWAKDPDIGIRMINARAETVATMPAFCRAALSGLG
jgi:putative SOS response-associated peptidase YedK